MKTTILDIFQNTRYLFLFEKLKRADNAFYLSLDYWQLFYPNLKLVLEFQSRRFKIANKDKEID